MGHRAAERRDDGYGSTSRTGGVLWLWQCPASRDVRRRLTLLLGIAALCAVGCRTAPLPPVNLKEPGWTVRSGQAVWHLPKDKREIAGDVLVATSANGEGVVQFSKTPFPLVSGRITSKQWEVEFPPQNKHYAAPGNPPVRLLWLYLSKAVSGQKLPSKLSWHEDANGWRLENRGSGEKVEGYWENAETLKY